MKKGKIIFLLFLLSFMFINIYALECNYGSYEVTYNTKGGKIDIASECVSSNVTSLIPTKKGYVFIGWSETDSNVVNYKAGANITLYNSRTLYAVWAKGKKLTFNANGGKSSKKSKSVYKGNSYGELPTATKKGYEFVGWYTKKSGGELISPDTIVSNGKNFSVYAHYKKVVYTINYELDGGYNNSKNKTSYTITNRVKLYNPSREGYIFKGWYKKSNYTGKISTINKGTTGNKTYYAKWSPIKYNIKYVGNGSKKGNTKTQKNLKYDKYYNIKNNWFTKKGYEFVGWNTKKNGTGTYYNEGQQITNLKNKNGNFMLFGEK